MKGFTKQSTSRNIIGTDIDTYRKWIEYQFTPEMNWSNIEIDQVKPTCFFNISDDVKLEEAFSWKNTETLLKETHSQKSTKNDFFLLRTAVRKNISIPQIK